MSEYIMKKKDKQCAIVKTLLSLTIVAALIPMTSEIVGRSWDKQSLLNEHDRIHYIQQMLKRNTQKQFMSPQEEKAAQQELERLVESHITYQKKPFKGMIYKIVPYTPKCSWCEQMRSEKQR